MVKRKLPSPAQAKAGISLALDNAEDHFDAASHLAGVEHWGYALAHVVLALEEAVKARVLLAFWLADTTGMPCAFNDDTMRELLFRNHRKRHALAIWQHASPEFYTNVARAAVPGQSATLSEHDERTVEWLAEAERVKERGLYCDLVGPEWQSPRSATRTDYETGRKLAAAFVEESRRQERLVASN